MLERFKVPAADRIYVSVEDARAATEAIFLAMGLSEEDAALANDLVSTMEANGADFTLTFRSLGKAAESEQAEEAVRGLFADPTAYDGWAVRWRQRLEAEPRLQDSLHGGGHAPSVGASRLLNSASWPDAS